MTRKNVNLQNENLQSESLSRKGGQSNPVKLMVHLPSFKQVLPLSKSRNRLPDRFYGKIQFIRLKSLQSLS
jgi:hypothetical protein